MSKIKLVGLVVIHLAALVVVLVDSLALKGSMTNLGNKEEEEEVLHLEIFLTSLKSSLEDSRVETDKEEAVLEGHQEVRILSFKLKLILWKQSTALKSKYHLEEPIYVELVRAASLNQALASPNVERVEALVSNL